MAAPTEPQVHATSIVMPGAVLIGQVTVERHCVIGPNAVLRGDIEPIIVEEGANVQDCVVIHTHKGNPVTIGHDASIGHGAVVHGATIEPHALVGMNAVVLDKAVVGERAVVGALALVPNGFKVPPRSLAVGIPCKIIKENDAGIAKMAEENGARYHAYREEHLSRRWGAAVGPLHDGGVYSR